MFASMVFLHGRERRRARKRRRPQPTALPPPPDPFSIFHLGSSVEDWLIAYIIGQHRQGRPLAEILEDRYIRNRCSGEQLQLLLERPRLVRGLRENFAREAEAIGAARAGGSGTPLRRTFARGESSSAP
jgi:hypothetical protein